MAPRGPASAFESETFGQDASFRLEQPVGSMTISPSGRDVALASKEGLHIIDLDSPYSPPRYLPHRTPWEVADVQWSPFAARDYWVISTSNQKALVWNLDARSWQDSIEFVLHGHTRAITDINFSAHNPDVLATCAVDSFVHCWDLRAPLRPVNSFSDWFAGATQVKWSRQDEHTIASSHDKFLHIWDDRKGAYPVRTIEAHGTKIYGIDWNRHHPKRIVTCSLDRTIKFWDLDVEDDMPERVIETSFPVWRARHTPFGWGLLVMPQRGNNDLHLYDRRAINGVVESGPVRPVASFAGHDGQVKEFLWRARGTIEGGVDDRDFQLVTWGTDRELRLHVIDRDIYTDIGYEKGVSKVQRLNFTRKGATYRSFRDEPGDADSPVEATPRSDMFPRQTHLMHFRPRMSTNVGMSKVPVSQFRGWAHGGRQMHRSAMHGRGNNRQSADPIAWLKNVKISSWDPDTLAEEIRQVGEKFKKVDFEVVDISHRKAVMSLQAPWGDDQSQVYLRMEMRFPKLYPRNANAVLTLQKSGFVDDATHKFITTELHTIAEIYASRKRGCLEAVLRYLLREQNLEQIVGWILGESLTDSKTLDAGTIQADDSSSDDDDEVAGVNERLEASANVMVPLAKGCGALWSDTGKLVCFFPTKAKEPVSFLSTLGLKDLEDSESNRLFEGFGRLPPGSPARKATGGTKTTGDDSGSEASDSSWKSSSSSSASFETDQNVRGASSYRIGASGMHQRSRSPDRSTHSTAGADNKLNDAPRTTTVSIHNFDDLLPSKRELAVEYRISGNGQEICKHNAMVARKVSRGDLASIWTLLGLVLDDAVPLESISDLRDGATGDIYIMARALSGNGELATTKTFGKTRWGNHPLGSTYLLPAIFDHFERQGDVQMLAMMSCLFASVLNRRTVPGDPDSDGWAHAVNGSLARSDYFPSKAVAKAFLRGEVTPEGYVLVDSVNVPASPNMQTLAGVQALHGDRRPYHVMSRQESALSSHAASTVGDDLSDRVPPNSTAVSLSTSPEGNRLGHRASSSVAYSSARASLSALTQSYSGSPPNHGSASTTGSGLKKYSPSSSLTPAWVSSGIFGGQSSSRPSRMSIHSSEAPSQDSRDANVRASLSSANLRFPLKETGLQSVLSRRNGRSVATADVSEHTVPRKPPRRKRIRTHLFNQDKFDLDGYTHSPLVEASLNQKYSAYRASYATLLDVWQLFLQRAEILQFDDEVPSSGSSAQQNRVPAILATSTNGHQPPQFMERARKTMASTSRASSPGLDISRCCRHCQEPLAPIEKNLVPIGWQCVNPACNPIVYRLGPTKVTKRSACAICNTSIDGLAVPCLECGHMTCYDCAQGWFGPRAINATPKSRRPSEESRPPSPINDETIPDSDASKNDHAICPTGCGCACATLTTINVSYPLSSERPQTLQVPNSAPPIASNNAVQESSRAPHRHSTMAHTESGADSALAAFLALTHSHQRSKSMAAASVARSKASSVSVPQLHGATETASQRANGEEATTRDDDGPADAAIEDDAALNPWAGSKMATLGRGIGAGLSRGLASKSSDATIRKAI